MKRSDYDIAFIEPDRVFIIDLDLGNKSVTNDAEKVFEEVQKLWPGRRLIYRDSMGRWDEIVAKSSWAGVVRMRQFWGEVSIVPYNEHVPNLK